MSERVICTVEGPCFHPASGLDLVPGEMEVSDEAAAVLEAAGLVSTPKKRATKPEKESE